MIVRPLRLSLGIGLLGAFIGIPLINSVVYMARIAGWSKTLRDLVVILLFAAATGAGLWLTLTAFDKT